MKILLLEDDYSLATSLKEILELEEYEVDIASNAEEAYEKSFNNSYDLYIFDINLPDESGIEVLKNLKKADDKTPAIFLTALTDLNTMAQAFEAGSEDYIKKPFDIDELLIRVRAKMKKKHSPIKIDNLEYDPLTEEIKKDNQTIHLSPTLKEIFHELILNKNQIVPKERLLEITETTDASLRVNINKLKKKLGIDIKNIRGEGYLIEV